MGGVTAAPASKCSNGGGGWGRRGVGVRVVLELVLGGACTERGVLVSPVNSRAPVRRWVDGSDTPVIFGQKQDVKQNHDDGRS